MFFRFTNKNAKRDKRYISTLNIKNMALKFDPNNLNSIKNKCLTLLKSYETPELKKTQKIEIGEDVIEIENNKKYREVMKFLNENYFSKMIKDNIMLIDDKGFNLKMQNNSNALFLGLNDINLNYDLEEISRINKFLDDLRKVVPKILVDIMLIKIINERKKFELKEEITQVLDKFLNEKEDFKQINDFIRIVSDYVNQVKEYILKFATVNTNINFKYDNNVLNWESLLNKINYFLLQYLNEISLSDQTQMYYNKVIFQKNKVDSIEMMVILRKRVKIIRRRRQNFFRNKRRNNRRNYQQQFFFKNTQLTLTNPNLLSQLLMIMNNNFYLIFKNNLTDNSFTLELPNLLLLNQLNVIRIYNIEKTKTKKLLILKNKKGTTDLQLYSFLEN